MNLRGGGAHGKKSRNGGFEVKHLNYQEKRKERGTTNTLRSFAGMKTDACVIIVFSLKMKERTRRKFCVFLVCAVGEDPKPVEDELK